MFNLLCTKAMREIEAKRERESYKISCVGVNEEDVFTQQAITAFYR